MTISIRGDLGRAKLRERIFVALCIGAALLPALMLFSLLAKLFIDGLPRRMVFLPESQIVPPALPAAATGAVLATFVAGPDAWFEFDFAQLLDQLVS